MTAGVIHIENAVPAPPPTITIELTLTEREACILRAALGNRSWRTLEAFASSLQTAAAHPPPADAHARDAGDLCDTLALVLEEALVEIDLERVRV